MLVSALFSSFVQQLNVKKALFSGVYSMATHGYAIVLQ
jgi:hypothetical protein